MVKISQAATLSLTTRLKQNRACRLRAHGMHRGSKVNDGIRTELSITEQLQMRLTGSFARHPGRYPQWRQRFCASELFSILKIQINMRIDTGVTAPIHQQHTQATDEGQQVQAGNGPQQALVVHPQAQYAALLVNLGNARVAPANVNGPDPALAAQNGPAQGVAMLLNAAAHLALNQ